MFSPPGTPCEQLSPAAGAPYQHHTDSTRPAPAPHHLQNSHEPEDFLASVVLCVLSIFPPLHLTPLLLWPLPAAAQASTSHGFVLKFDKCFVVLSLGAGAGVDLGPRGAARRRKCAGCGSLRITGLVGKRGRLGARGKCSYLFFVCFSVCLCVRACVRA